MTMKDDLTEATEAENGSTKQEDAVERIQPLLEEYAAMVGGDGMIGEDTLTDFLADIMHWAKATDEEDFDASLGSAQMHYSHETDDDEDDEEDDQPRPAAPKVIEVQASCAASVKETWHFLVPADWQPPAGLGDSHEDAFQDLLDDPLAVLLADERAIFTGCTNDVSDETDRVVTRLFIDNEQITLPRDEV